MEDGELQESSEQAERGSALGAVRNALENAGPWPPGYFVFHALDCAGGRYWVRTSDPCRVKTVLYR